jgi:hypothetical protein
VTLEILLSDKVVVITDEEIDRHACHLLRGAELVLLFAVLVSCEAGMYSLSYLNMET